MRRQVSAAALFLIVTVSIPASQLCAQNSGPAEQKRQKSEKPKVLAWLRAMVQEFSTNPAAPRAQRARISKEARWEIPRKTQGGDYPAPKDHRGFFGERGEETSGGTSPSTGDSSPHPSSADYPAPVNRDGFFE